MTALDGKTKARLIEKHRDLIENIVLDATFWAELISRKVVTADNCEMISKNKTNTEREQIIKLLQLLRKRSRENFLQFCLALHETVQDHVIDILGIDLGVARLGECLLHMLASDKSLLTEILLSEKRVHYKDDQEDDTRSQEVSGKVPKQVNTSHEKPGTSKKKTSKLLTKPKAGRTTQPAKDKGQGSDKKKSTTAVRKLTIANLRSTEKGLTESRMLRVTILQAEPARPYRDNPDMEVIEGVIADNTGKIKFSCYQRKAFPFMQRNKSVEIHTFISKPTEVMIASHTSVVEIPKIKIPNRIQNVAHFSRSPMKMDHEAEVRGISQISTYAACHERQCSYKKLDRGKCPKCGTRFRKGDRSNSVRCKLALGDGTDVILFHHAVAAFLGVTDLKITTTKNTEKKILALLPCKIQYTLNKGTNIVSNLSRICPDRSKGARKRLATDQGEGENAVPKKRVK